MAQTVENIFKTKTSDADYFKKYGVYLGQLIDGLDPQAIMKVIEVFEKASQEGRTIFFAGNGGSAATASHFAQDIGEIVRKVGGKPFRTFSLNDHAAALTAISNDYDYSQVFTLQMANHINKGDVLVVISASGNSPNVVKAVEMAKQHEATTVALVGFDGGQLAKISDIVVMVKSEKGQYGPVEDVHMVLDHMITMYISLKRRNAS